MKKTAKPKVTQEQYEAALKEFDKQNRAFNTQTAKMNEAVAKVNEKYNPLIKAADDARNTAFDTVERYCSENKDTLFTDDKKSVETRYGIIGFRLGKHKVSVDKEKSKGLVERMKKLAWAKDYIVDKPQLDKNAILKVKEDVKLMTKFEALGVTVEQDEAFYIDPKE